ncbi:hypothetical protein DYB32_001156 [Aphanomyces invadans]|uniref:ZZ-type domain-containing protein n=1 Tax=Aphanomyces invadans TaxID=157072 RepID=A0A418B7D9_9STRA|nr:hypothetical protein DYB32_001156 [Aphanomyces invadans]
MVHVPQFEAPGNHGPDRIVSDTFAIDEHSFCLWIFPRGNPNEVEYYDRSLSVYLVVTDLEKRPLDWLTCAVFTLSVVHPTDPSKTIRWHSSLHDNKFNHALYNWGVHSLGDLSSFKPNGFVFPDGSLRVSTRVRLMSISVRVHVEAGFMAHEGLGLGPHVCTIDLPFCSTLADLLAALASRFPATDAKRPRKCLSALTTSTPLFGNLLCDGTDIDAYSCCDLFLDPASLDSFVFVKVLDLHTGVLRYVGRLCLSAFPTAQAIVAYLAVAFPHVAHWMSVREECAPQLASMLSPVDRLLPSDVVIFAECTPTRAGASPTSDTNTDRWMMRVRRCLDQYLDRHYKHAKALIANRLHHITLHDIECIGDLLDLPRFRIHSVFAKCHENARRTLQYIMEGRHLGFICDSCGETDFVGARYNCTVCSDYDLCHPCFERSHQVRHRYANVDGKWRRVPNFDDHNPATHPMHCIYPVFS